ncbi:hypothetical protein BH11BAC3_BH11BAC3_14160 [soil metagenome]
MDTTDNIGFISTSIKQLKNAVMHTHSNDLINLPDITVHAIDVDDNGFLWFTILKPHDPIAPEGKSFYVGLNFYRKGIPFLLNISGIASLVTTEDALSKLPLVLKRKVTDDRLMVSVKIKDVDYYEIEESEPNSIMQKCKKLWAEIFETEAYYPAAN